MTCFFCKGTMEDSVTMHLSQLGTGIVVVKNVPCYKCTQCGEVVYPLGIGERLEEIINTLRNTLTEVAIVTYSEAA